MKVQNLFHVDKLRKYHIDLEIYQGANWMDLPRDVLEYLLEYFDSHEEVERLFRSGFCPDEFWIQTILCNSPYRERIIPDIHRYIVWQKKYGSYPAILDGEDYEPIRAGNYHFIRKVAVGYSDELMEKLLV